MLRARGVHVYRYEKSYYGLWTLYVMSHRQQLSLLKDTMSVLALSHVVTCTELCYTVFDGTRVFHSSHSFQLLRQNTACSILAISRSRYVPSAFLPSITHPGIDNCRWHFTWIQAIHFVPSSFWQLNAQYTYPMQIKTHHFCTWVWKSYHIFCDKKSRMRNDYSPELMQLLVQIYLSDLGDQFCVFLLSIKFKSCYL